MTTARLVYPFSLDHFAAWLVQAADLADKPGVAAVAVVAEASGIHIACFKSADELAAAFGLAPAAQPAPAAGDSS
jgi:hypothetical protein